MSFVAKLIMKNNRLKFYGKTVLEEKYGEACAFTKMLKKLNYIHLSLFENVYR